MSGKPTFFNYMCATLNAKKRGKKLSSRTKAAPGPVDRKENRKPRSSILGKLRRKLRADEPVVVTAQEFSDVLALRNVSGETDAMYQRLLALEREELVAFASQKKTNHMGWSPLQRAADFPEAFSIFRLLVEEGGADPRLAAPCFRTTPLMIAARAPYCVETIRYLVEVQHVDIEATEDYFNRTAVDHALQYDTDRETQKEALEILLRNGANPNGRENCRSPLPLRIALARGNAPLVALLLRYGADPTRDDGDTALHFLLDEQRSQLQNLLITHRWHPPARIVCGLVSLLLDREAELFLQGYEDLDDTWVSLVETDRRDLVGGTPLDVVNFSLLKANTLYATSRQLHQCNQKVAEVVQLLLQHYQRVVTKRMGNNSLHWILREAIYDGHDGVVLPLGKLTISQLATLLNLLVTANPSAATTVDATGALPLHSACHRSETPLEVIQCLVDLSPDALTATNHIGFTPITAAALFDASIDVLFFLLSEGPDAGNIENLRHHVLDRQV